MAIRTPKVAQPLAKLDARPARYALSCSASRSSIGGAAAPASREPAGTWLSWVCTTAAASTSAAAYARNGTRRPKLASSPPTIGPHTLPIRKADAYAPETRPRLSGGASRTTRAIDATVNITEPAPPRPRNTSNCQ